MAAAGSRNTSEREYLYEAGDKLRAEVVPFAVEVRGGGWGCDGYTLAGVSASSWVVV